MVRVTAEPVGRLAVSVLQRVDRSALGERLQGPVDRRQADAEPAPAELDVELLRTRAVRLALELPQDSEPLRGRPQAGLPEEVGVSHLRCCCHVA